VRGEIEILKGVVCVGFREERWGGTWRDVTAWHSLLEDVEGGEWERCFGEREVMVV